MENQNEIMSPDNKGTQPASGQPTPISGILNSPDSKISPAHSKKRVYVITLIVCVLLSIVATGALIFYHSRQHNKNTSSNSQLSADSYTEQDLNKITGSVLNYGNKHSTLPTTIQALNVSELHYSLSNYSYNPTPANPTNEAYIGQGNGAASKFTGFDICGTFKHAGLDVTTASTHQSMGSNGLDPGIFVYHREGKQCYSYSFGAYGVGGPTLTPVLTSTETSAALNQSEGSVYPVDNNVDYATLITSSQSLFASLTKSMGNSPASMDVNSCRNVTGSDYLIRYTCTVEVTDTYNVGSDFSTEEGVMSQL